VIHQSVRVDDSGRLRPQGPDGSNAGLEGPRIHLGQSLEHNPIGSRVLEDRLQLGELLDGDCGDDLPDSPMRDFVGGAQSVEPHVAPTLPGFQRARRIVAPRVDHLAGAARRLHAGARVAIENDEVGMVAGEASRNRETHDSGPDDGDAGVSH
jgi:hypothetical protein